MNPYGTILLPTCPICMAASVLDKETLISQGLGQYQSYRPSMHEESQV